MTTDHPGPRARDRAEAQFLLLAESAAEMIVRADADGVMTYVSPAALQITGFAPDELVGCAAWELAHTDDLPIWRASRERLSWGLDGETLTYRGRRRGGGWVMLESTLRAVRDAEGEVVELQIATRDVTERALADAEHDALHRVTEAVASESEGAALYPLVAREMARLLDAAAGRVVRYRGDGAEEEVGAWRRPGPPAGGGGPPHVVSAPIRVHGRLWGAVAAVFRAPVDAPWGAAERVERFAQLVRLAVANAETRERLVEQATTDALTGLVNHATFHVALSEAFDEPPSGSAARSRSRSSTSTASRRSTTPWATGPATWRSRRSATSCAATRAAATSLDARAARSSAGSCPRPGSRAAAPPPSACARPSPRRRWAGRRA